VGKVSAFTLEGLDLWFNSSDHLPPHFHARKPDAWEIRVYFLLCTEGHLVFEKRWPPGRSGPRAQDRNAILRATLRRRVALLEEWGQKVQTKERT
jgi:hypothetical protein